MRLLTEIQIQELVNKNPSWELVNKGLEKQFKFDSFLEAINKMKALSVEVDKLNHHPEWKNVYSTVWVRITTHDAGGLTEKDIFLLNLVNDYFD